MPQHHAPTHITLREALYIPSALRLLLAPVITGRAESNCAVVARLVGMGERLTVNYWVGEFVAVVRSKVGNLRRYEVPCVVDVRRMPPLRRYVEAGLAEIRDGEVIVGEKTLLTPLARFLSKIVNCIADKPQFVKKIATCANVDIREAAFGVSLLRLLYPATLEIFGNHSVDNLLSQYGVGAKLPAAKLWRELLNIAEEGYIFPNAELLRGRRPVIIRSKAAKYSIPPILASLNYKDAVVIDVGSGFGTKGAATIKWGARYAILLDIDEAILRARGNGLLIDKVVGDAQMLPFRDKSADVVIFWNVYNFLHKPEDALLEIKRIARRAVVFSIYNAASGRYVSYREFLKVVATWGRVKVVKRLGDSQFQAVVET